MKHPALNIAVRAARAAGREILRLSNRLQNLEVVERSRNEFATEADQRAEQQVIYHIQQSYPDHAFLAEESGRRGDGDAVWVIDPLDGTTNFLHDLPHYCVSLALQINGQVELGVIYNPRSEEMFTASRGAGAYLNDQRIRVAKRAKLDGAVLGAGFAFRTTDKPSQYQAIYQRLQQRAVDIRRSGSSALDCAYVACGRLDGCWDIDLKPWDVAAGSLMITEAGGFCSDFAGRSDFLDNGRFVAAAPRVAPDLQQLLFEGYREGA